MSFLEAMIILISTTEVNIDAYSAFVDSIVSNLTPTQPIVANLYVKTVSDIVKSVVAFMLILAIIVMVVIIVSFSLTSTTHTVGVNRYMTTQGGLLMLVCTIAIAAVFYYAVISSVYNKLIMNAKTVQTDTSGTVLYAINSIIRDMLYSALCK